MANSTFAAVVGGVGAVRELVAEAQRSGRHRVPVLAADGEVEDAGRDAVAASISPTSAAAASTPANSGGASSPLEDRARGGVVQPLPGTVDPDRDVDRRQVPEPDHVVEVEVGEHDVERLDAVEQRGVLDEPADARSGVDQQHVRAVALT